MAVGFYGNEREEDEAGAWQSTVKQTAQGCGWDPHEVGECPRGEGSKVKSRTCGESSPETKLHPVQWFRLVLSSVVWDPDQIMQYHLLYIWSVLHRENHHRVPKHQCDILPRSINQIPAQCRCKPTDGFVAQQIDESDPCGSNTHPDFFATTFCLTFYERGGGEDGRLQSTPGSKLR